MLKLDSMGCLIPDCDETQIIYQPAHEIGIFNIYPNPIINTSTVEITIPDDLQIIPGEKLSLHVFDIVGKLVDRYSNIQVSNPNEVIRFNMYKRNLAKGVYEVELNYAGERLGVLKIVVE